VLFRSVEMTEAQLNYMIGETDAVLRSLFLEDSFATVSRIAEVNRAVGDSKENSEDYFDSIKDITNSYLSSYRKELDESRRDLSGRIDVLEKEKQKLTRIRDIRKREFVMRRKTALDAFKLERERELSKPVSIGEVKPVATKTAFASETRNTKVLLPSQHRAKYAELRRSLTSRNNSPDRSENPSLNASTVNSPRSGYASYYNYNQPEKLDLSLSRMANASTYSFTSEPVSSRFQSPRYTVTPQGIRVDARDYGAGVGGRVSQIYSLSDEKMQQKSEMFGGEYKTLEAPGSNDSSNKSPEANTSMINESQQLLQEYQQLRSNSINEIQRAQDSLKTSMQWLEKQKMKRRKNSDFRWYQPLAYSTTSNLIICKLKTRYCYPFQTY